MSDRTKGTRFTAEVVLNCFVSINNNPSGLTIMLILSYPNFMRLSFMVLLILIGTPVVWKSKKIFVNHMMDHIIGIRYKDNECQRREKDGGFSLHPGSGEEW